MACGYWLNNCSSERWTHSGHDYMASTFTLSLKKNFTDGNALKFIPLNLYELIYDAFSIESIQHQSTG
jgi:hypothetical protein